MNQRGFISLAMIQLIALASVSGLLYWQISENGKIRAERNQLIADVKAANESAERIKKQAELTEFVVVDNLTKRETIYRDRDVVQYRIREVIKNVEPTDCAVQPVHPDLLRLLIDGNKTGAGEDVPPGIPVNLHRYTVDASPDLRGFSSIRNLAAISTQDLQREH